MYCVYCGKKLNDGELCDCPQSRAMRMAKTSSAQDEDQNVTQQDAAQGDAAQNFLYIEDPTVETNAQPGGQTKDPQTDTPAQQSPYQQTDNNSSQQMSGQAQPQQPTGQTWSQQTAGQAHAQSQQTAGQTQAQSQQTAGQTQSQQNTYRQTDTRDFQQQGGQYGTGRKPSSQTQVFTDMWEFLKLMFKNPVDAIWHVKKEQDFLCQYIFGGIYLLLLLLITWGSMSEMLGGGKAFGTGFAIMASFALCKLIYAAGIYLYNYKEGGTFTSALALTCASTIFESTFLIGMGLSVLAGSVTMAVFFALLAFLVGVIMQGVILVVVTKKNPSRSFWICLLFDVFIIIVMTIIMRAIARDVAQYFISAIFGALNYY